MIKLLRWLFAGIDTNTHSLGDRGAQHGPPIENHNRRGIVVVASSRVLGAIFEADVQRHEAEAQRRTNRSRIQSNTASLR
jgi:hypothetical protein